MVIVIETGIGKDEYCFVVEIKTNYTFKQIIVICFCIYATLCKS